MREIDVLFVDDDGDFLRSLVRALSPLLTPYSLHGVGSATQAIHVSTECRPLVSVLDLCIDERRGVDSGYELLSSLRSLNSSQRILVLTGHGSTACGIRAMELGASSFIDKTATPEHLAALIKDAVAQSRLRREYEALRRDHDRGSEWFFTGASVAHTRLMEELDFAATTSQPVLLIGETGTGKSVCARMIHNRSARASKNFVHYHPNFGGGDLVQSELFGHVRGAYTGASESRDGLVSQADGGSLFVDELDEVPIETQVRLLDLLQEYRVRPVGSDSFVSVNCRFMAATNRPLEEALASGKIRRDLYHRISHCLIRVPPLRDRRDDIAAMAKHFLSRVARRESIHVFEFSDQALVLCEEYSWPGNVRELQAAVETAAFRAAHKGRAIIQRDDLSLGEKMSMSDGEPHLGAFHERLEAFKRRLVQEALHSCSGNQVRAAKLLGVDRGTIRRLSAEGAIAFPKSP